METRNEIRPFLPTHPGLILRAELKARGIKQRDFADQIGMRPSHLSALLHGGRNISPQLATRLEDVLKIPAKVWLNLQANYNLDILRPSELVDGYSGQCVQTYALAEPDQGDKALWKMAFKAGRIDLAQKVKARIEQMNLPSELQSGFLAAIVEEEDKGN